MAIGLNTGSPDFFGMLRARYAGFLQQSARPDLTLTVEPASPGFLADPDADVEVHAQDGKWNFRRGDFVAEWDPRARAGRVRQTVNPYSIDSVLRIIHTLVLAPKGGFLLHASSAVRNGRAFLFTGLSGAGKTTISRLAPPDVALLTDEVSYLRPDGGGYRAYGTPFAGELAKPGENVSAPVAALYFLAKGSRNRIDAVDPAEAGRMLLRNILFFAEDEELVKQVFQSAWDFLERVPAWRLTFVPDQRVWELIG